MPKDLTENAPNVSALAKACGVARSTVYSWQRDSTFPQPVKGKGFDVFAVGCWKGRKDEATRQHERIPGDDPLLAGGGSPELERYRAARASMAELDLAERQNVMVNMDLVHDLLNGTADIFRRSITILQKQCGPDAFSIMENAVEEAKSYIEKFFGDESNLERYCGANHNESEAEVDTQPAGSSAASVQHVFPGPTPSTPGAARNIQRRGES